MSEQRSRTMRLALRHGLVAALLCAGAVPAPAATPADAPVPSGVRKVPADRLAHYWLLDPDSAQANVPNSGAGLDTPTCAAVDYVIEKNGTTSHVKLERVVPEGPLGKVALNIVRGMRFAPAAQNAGKDPVATSVVIPFNVPVATSPKADERALRTRVLAACTPYEPAPGAR